DPHASRKYWPDMRGGSFVAIGWPELGDLTGVPPKKDAKDWLRGRMQGAYPASPQVVGRQAQQVWNFLHMNHGDIVVAADGSDMLGIGRVMGPYRFDSSRGFPHQHPVEWLDLGEWRLPVTEGLQTTVYELR